LAKNGASISEEKNQAIPTTKTKPIRGKETREEKMTKNIEIMEEASFFLSPKNDIKLKFFIGRKNIKNVGIVEIMAITARIDKAKSSEVEGREGLRGFPTWEEFIWAKRLDEGKLAMNSLIEESQTSSEKMAPPEKTAMEAKTPAREETMLAKIINKRDFKKSGDIGLRWETHLIKTMVSIKETIKSKRKGRGIKIRGLENIK